MPPRQPSNRLSLSERRRNATSAVGEKAKQRAKSQVKSQLTKKVTKKVAKSGVKNAARLATGATSLLVEAGFAILFSKTGKKVMLITVAVILLFDVAMAAVFISILVGNNQSSATTGANLTKLALTAAQKTPGLNLSKIAVHGASGAAAQLQPFYNAGSTYGVSWTIPLAVAYYESMGGQAVAKSASSCMPSLTQTYCAPTSSGGYKPIKGVVGPFGLISKQLPYRGLLTHGIAVTPSIKLINTFTDDISQLISKAHPNQGSNIASGLKYDSQNQPVYSNTKNSQSYEAAVIAALAQMPIANNSPALDKNIYWLSKEWAAGGSSAPSTSFGFGGGQICYTSSGSQVTIPDRKGRMIPLNSQELGNAKSIVQATKSIGLPQAASVIALMTALQESTLFNYPNSKVPGSIGYPGSQLGHYTQSNPPNNGTSLGLFQQQNGWGTIAQRLNPATSTKLFLQGLVKNVPNWQSQAYGKDAQTVQGSAYPLRYQGWQPGADELLGELNGVSCKTTATTTSTKNAPTTASNTVIDAATSYVNQAPYVWGGGNATGPTMGSNGKGYHGKPGFDCSGLVLYAYAQAGITLPHFSGAGYGQFAAVERSSTYTTNIAQLQAGMIVFFVGVGDGGSTSSPGHVGIYIGNGKMVNAPYTGKDVSLAQVTTASGGGFVGGGFPVGFNPNA
jgi:cell wall-associated NlpC family hydrolase